MGWSWSNIESRLKAWNATNLKLLQENYLIGQLRYAKQNKHTLLPPNCANTNYYKELGFCTNMTTLCSKIKNPVNYSRLAVKNAIKSKKKS